MHLSFRLSIGAEMEQMLNTNPEFKQKLEEALVFLENQCIRTTWRNSRYE